MTDAIEAVRVKNLTIQFGDFTAVNNISFTVHRGEIFGFLGANGAGKTTTIRMLCGLLEPTTGEVEIAGINYKVGADRIKEKVGYMSQKFTLYNDLTVAENLWFSSHLRKLDPAFVRRRIQELFEFIGFDQRDDKLVRHLAGGLKQELSLVASLLHDPELVFLDEPTAGVSPVSRKRFWDLIKQLSSLGKTVFVTTHYMDEAEQCHRIALMRAGEIIALDTPHQLKTTAFPDILLEVYPDQVLSKIGLEQLRHTPGILSVVPYGRRYHVIATSDQVAQTITNSSLAISSVRRITPSLEDVFIRLVEGKGR